MLIRDTPEGPLYDPEEKKKRIRIHELLKRADLLCFDPSKPIEKPVPVISYEGETISSPQNITVLTGQSKAGKTGVFGAWLAGTLGGSEVDTCGFTISDNSEGKLVFHADSEQSEYNHFNAVSSVINRAGKTDVPKWFKSYLLRKLSTNERLEITEGLLEKHSKEFGGIHSVFIDGIGDYCQSVNDELEVNRVIQFFEKVSIKHNCPVITVLHLNPGSTGTEKSRGHLGSHLERKCESMFTVSKDKESGISTIELKYSRNTGNIPNIEFQYDVERGFHVSLGAKKTTSKETIERHELAQMALDIFSNGTLKFTYGELVEEIKELHHLQERTAKAKIALMRKYNFIKNEGDTRSKLTLCNGAILVQDALKTP